MPPPGGFGVNVIASVRKNVGLGVTARNWCLALRRHGVPLAIADIAHEWGGVVDIGELNAHVARYSGELRHPVNLYVLSLAQFETLFTSCPWLLVPGRLHIASMWWEASAIPPPWLATLGRLDAMLTSSSFMTHLAANSLELMPVIEAEHPLALPAGIAPDRARFGIPESATAFVMSFDPNSDPARKNPLGAIAAFHMAFPGVHDVRLVIRVNNADTHWGPGAVAEMRHMASTDTRVSFLLEPMDYEDVLTLYASGDVFVSLHRGEGLGLPILESMLLGKPVIGTAWSGSTDLVDHACGAPIRYVRKPVNGNWQFFKPEFIGRDAFWAEPMIDDAAAWMRRLHADRGFREELGAAAKRRAQAHQERAWSRAWIDRIEAFHRAQSFIPRPQHKFSAIR